MSLRVFWFAQAFFLIFVPVLLADDGKWPEFRGPAGDGRADNAVLPLAINESVVQWQRPIHGKGWSSPVVWDDQIWLTTATDDGKQMSVVCVDRTSGKVLHDVVVIENEDPEYCHPMNSYATPTAAIEQGRLYVHFGTYGTLCLDTSDASVIWRRADLKCNHYRGPASSPILHDGKLFVAFDGIDVQFVVALDTSTGDTLWKKKREIDYGTTVGDRMKAYGTGKVIQVGDQDQLIYPSAMATIAYDPETGRTLWMVYHAGMNAAARPIYEEGIVLISNGSGGMVAVRPDGNGNGNVTDSHVAWKSMTSVPKKSSPIVVDRLVYMVSDDGIVSCRQLADGKIVWQKRVGGPYAASPIYADGRLYFFGIEGDILTIKGGRTYEMIAKTKLGDGFMASPAVVGDQLILRSKSVLYSLSAR